MEVDDISLASGPNTRSGLQPCVRDGRAARLASGKPGGEERERGVARSVRAGRRHRSILVGAAKLAGHLEILVGDELEASQRAEQVTTRGRRLEEARPALRLVEPLLEVFLEAILDLGRHLPEGHASRRIEELPAARP